ncbi:hypothetical protein [Bosea sp. BK604]|uniref:hypothetical protein n=1 Tax=Bosea sp. BK604 TaxID=2512180 RepID=UPI00105401C2|nr:hypothetical protein [Bosea sp. BK604]TCR70016.1 hypothetical protein EV560_101418 [Bosea sp. BK604]
MSFFKYKSDTKISGEEIRIAISSITAEGGDRIYENYREFSDKFSFLLSIDPGDIDQIDVYHGALKHAFDYYYWKWDRRAVEHHRVLGRAIEKWLAASGNNIGLVCDLIDFFFFVVWCFGDSNTKQCEFAVGPMRAASAALSRSGRIRLLPSLPKHGPATKIVWLAMFADSGNPMSTALQHFAKALEGSGHKLSVYAWRFHDEAFATRLREMGGDCCVLARDTPAEALAAIEGQLAIDKPHVIISDMNNAIPTVLFSRRVAPVQIFLQAGMPAWPIRNLDAVFNSFGIAPEIAGWGNARMLDFNPPWDLSTLNQARSPDLIAQSRARLPDATKLIGSYGRLVKVTRPYLEAAERILQSCPDAALIIGGTGDDSDIRAFIAASAVGGRMHVETGWVDGHVWGRLIDVFLDTWPVTGGESSREMIAKGRPVVTLHSEEMPAIVAQRDSSLVAANWDEFCEIATRLLNDRAEYEGACRRSQALAERMSDTKAFAKKIIADISTVVADARRRPIGFRFFGR